MAVFTWIQDLGGQGLAGLFRAFFPSQPPTGAMPAGPRKGLESGATIERSMNWLLGILNLPSKTDYNRLLSKVEVLQGSLMNLNIKVDRLLAIRDRPRREAADERGRGEDGPG